MALATKPACRVGPVNRRESEERKISTPAPGPGRKIFAFFALFQCILKGAVGRQPLEILRLVPCLTGFSQKGMLHFICYLCYFVTFLVTY
jgi:hypothetical protein